MHLPNPVSVKSKFMISHRPSTDRKPDLSRYSSFYMRPVYLQMNGCSLLRSLLFILILSQLIPECISGTLNLSGTVVGVSDGDTISVLLKDNKQIRVRLDGIDCPELHQAYGSKAKQYTSALVFHKTVDVIAHGIDSYGRTLGIITLNGINLNEELVRVGLAWAYVHYSSQYLPLEKSARSKKIGLWTDNKPIPPWEFRHQHKRSMMNPSNKTATIQNSTQNSSTIYITSKGKKYHRMDCKTLSQRGIPISLNDAKKRGLTPCRLCKP
jgi:micrococcal nuclease